MRLLSCYVDTNVALRVARATVIARAGIFLAVQLFGNRICLRRRCLN